MATASVTYALTNGTTADASQVDTNFDDLVGFLNSSVVHTDGSKSLTGLLTLHAADPSSSNHATRKSYVDVKGQQAIRVSQTATPSGTSVAGSLTLATVTVTDPGYDIYVEGHGSVAAFSTGQTTAWSVWSLLIKVDGVTKDRLDIPHSIGLQGAAGISFGIPLRRIAKTTGSNTSVTLHFLRQTGDGEMTVGGDGTTNNLQVYSFRQ
jgi:hypothetical protein